MRYIIIPYEDYNTVIEYIARVHLYFLAKPLVYSQTVDIPETNITDLKKELDETYEHVNHMYIVHFRHLYMNGIHIFLCCYLD